MQRQLQRCNYSEQVVPALLKQSADVEVQVLPVTAK